MSSIIPFAFSGHDVRVVQKDGEPLFVGKDVCDALGFVDATNSIKKHCNGVPKRHPIFDNLGRTQEVRVLTEGDVMRLIVRSKLPTAQEFERLVFDVILPTIRRTGSYHPLQSGDLTEDARKTLEGMIKSIARTQFREELEAMEKRITSLLVTRQAGTAVVHDKTATEWCKEYGLLQKGRNGPRTRIGYALSSLAKQRGIRCERCARTNTWLYPAELARPYMDTIGEHIIREHNQSVLRKHPNLQLVKRRKKNA